MNEQDTLGAIEKRAAELKAFREQWVDQEFATVFPSWEKDFKNLEPKAIRQLIETMMHYSFNGGMMYNSLSERPEIMAAAKKIVDANPILTAEPVNKTAH